MRALYKLIIALSAALVISLTVVGLYLAAEANRNPDIYSSGHGSTLNTTISVDNVFSNYVNITVTGQSGAGQETTFNGSLVWIGSSDGSVQALHNIHLTAYTRLDQNATWGPKTYMLYNGLYIKATPNAISVPSDALDHKEVIAPELSAQTPTYPFSFTLSVYT